jgi:hypothetical protein
MGFYAACYHIGLRIQQFSAQQYEIAWHQNIVSFKIFLVRVMLHLMKMIDRSLTIVVL